MMLPDGIEKLLQQTRPKPDPIQEEMEDYADIRQFPIIGPDTGALLELLARIKNAKNVFEFGSGFGYSAYWLLRGMPNDGQITLTETDESELKRAREFFDRADELERSYFEHGDAVDIARQSEIPPDIILIDFDKRRYPEAFRAIEENLKSDSLIIADNIMRGPANYSEVLKYLRSSSGQQFDSKVEGIGSYLEIVTGENYATSIIPIGNGISLTVRSSTEC